MKVPVLLGVFDAVADYLRGHGFREWAYKTIPHIYHRHPAEDVGRARAHQEHDEGQACGLQHPARATVEEVAQVGGEGHQGGIGHHPPTRPARSRRGS